MSLIMPSRDGFDIIPKVSAIVKTKIPFFNTIFSVSTACVFGYFVTTKYALYFMPKPLPLCNPHKFIFAFFCLSASAGCPYTSLLSTVFAAKQVQKGSHRVLPDFSDYKDESQGSQDRQPHPSAQQWTPVLQAHICKLAMRRQNPGLASQNRKYRQC